MVLDQINDLDSQDFMLQYRKALSETKIYITKHEVRELIASLLNGENILEKNDQLVKFLSLSLDKNLPLNWLTGNELIEASKIKIAGAKILNEDLIFPQHILNILNGRKFILDNRMLVFTNEKALLYDVTLCDKINLLHENDITISILDNSLISKKPREGFSILESLMEQSRGLTGDY